MKRTRNDMRASYAGGQPARVQDRPRMKSVLDAYNHQYPDMNAFYATSFTHAADTARGLLERPGAGPVRCVCFDEAERHHLALEFRKSPDGSGISYIGIDSLRYKQGSDFLHAASHEAREQGMKGLIVFTDVQRSSHGCAVFSLGFLKALRKDPDTSLRLHEMAMRPEDLAGLRFDPAHRHVAIADERAAFDLLPAAFAKHAQSGSRLEQIMDQRPALASDPVNGSGNTLRGRLGQIRGKDGPEASAPRPGSGAGEGQDISEEGHFNRGRSIEEKRIRMYDKGIDHLKGRIEEMPTRWQRFVAWCKSGLG